MNIETQDEIAPIAQRIEQAKAHKAEANGLKLSWSRLAQEIGLTVTAPNNWKKGKISTDTIEAIAKYTGVSFEWLKSGEGEMLPENAYIHKQISFDSAKTKGEQVLKYVLELINNDINDFLKPFGEMDYSKDFQAFSTTDRVEFARLYSFPDIIIKKKGTNDVYAVIHIKAKQNIAYITITNRRFDLNKSSNIKPVNQNEKLIPIISYVQAGAFKEAILERQDEYLVSYLTNLSNYAFALIVRGDSMFPDFKEGDKIIVDPNISPKPGDFVIAQNGGNEATFKKYRPRGFDEEGREYFELVPLNEEYPTMDSRFQNIQIIGTVVEHLRSLRKI